MASMTTKYMVFPHKIIHRFVIYYTLPLPTYQNVPTAKAVKKK